METGNIDRCRFIIFCQRKFSRAIIDCRLTIICTAISMIGHFSASNVYISRNGTLLDVFCNLFQLVLCSRPAALDFSSVPIYILQPCNVIIFIRVRTGSARLLANDDAARITAIAVSISAYADAGKAYIICRGHGNIITAAGDGDVLALNKVDLPAGRRHIFPLAAVDVQFPAGIDRIRHGLELIFRSRPATDDTIGIGFPGRVGQARNKGAVFRLGGIAIFLGSGNASLIADGHATDAALASTAIKADFITSRNSAFHTVDGDFLISLAAQRDAVIEFHCVLAVSRLVIVGDGDVGITGELGCLRGAVGNILHIADIGPVGGGVIGRLSVGRAVGAAAHILDLIAAKGNLIPVDDHVLGFIIDIVGDGNAAIILDGLARGDRSQVF